MTCKVIFMGTPDFAAVQLQALIDLNLEIAAVYCGPDKKVGRGHKLTPCKVKELALAHNLKILQPASFKDEAAIEEFKALKADLAVVAAYGHILPEAVLNAPRLGSINVHGSLLPLYRGAAPIQRALLDGQERTGVTIMQMAKALDAGNILYQKEIAIAPGDTSGTLFDKIAALGAQALKECIGPLLEGRIVPVAQDESKVTYASKITKEEALLNFNEDAATLERKVRGYSPWPAAWFSFKGVSYKVFEAKVLTGKGDPGTILSTKDGLEIACKEGSLLILKLQAPGKGPAAARDFVRTRPEFAQGALL